MSPINDSSNIPEVSSLSSPGVSSISIYPPPSVSFSMAGASSQPRSSGSKNIPAVQTPGSYSLHDSSDSEVEENIPPASASNRPKTYMTKFKIQQKKRDDKLRKIADCHKAVTAYKRGKFKSMLQCAKAYNIPQSTLYDLIRTGGEYQGRGKQSGCLTQEEEGAIVQHVKWRVAVGCGVDWRQLQNLIQEVLLGIKVANPERSTGYEATGQLPNISFVRRLAQRHNLSLRRSSEISKGRQILGKVDLMLWQQETEKFLLGDPKLKEALMDPRRVFNQDETAVEVGSECQRVLAEVNTKVVYSISGGSREHITTSFLCGADGSMVPPRCIYKGVRNVAQTHLKDLPKDGKSGEWNFSVSEKGYITRDLYVEVLRDLDSFLSVKNIPRPVILFIDGANPHISLQAASFCKEKQIQPWLLKPNMTHLLQPLDLTFFSSLKKQLKKSVWDWQCTPSNAGTTLNKYSVVALLHQATELCLDRPDLISNGFKRAGIFPWDPTAPDTDKLLPGTIFQTSDIPVLNEPQQVMEDNEIQSAGQSPVDAGMDVDILDTNHSVIEVTTPQVLESPEMEIDFPVFDAIPQPSTSQLLFLPGELDITPPNIFSSVEVNKTPQHGQMGDSQVFDPSSEVPNKPYWHGKTQICPNCDKRILNRFMECHSQSCKPVEIPSTPHSSSLPSNETVLDSVPEFSLDDRITHLNKFEVLLLNPTQVKEFNEFFSKKKFDVKEPIFHSWLSLKLASIPTEAEALDRILKAHTVQNVPKRKQKRSGNLPTGAARYDPTSPEWVAVLTEQDNKKKKVSEKKTSAKPPTNLPSKSAAKVKTAKKKLRV